MIAIILRSDTTSRTGIIRTTGDTSNDNYYEPDENDYRKFERLDHLEDIKMGWFNPVKLQLNNKPVFKYIQKVIRNQLPIKIRYD